MVASVNAHIMTTFAGVKSVSVPALNTTGGPGTIFVVLFAAPSAPLTAAAALQANMAGVSESLVVTDNQNNSYVRMFRNSQAGVQFGIPNAVVTIWAANESSIAQPGGTQSLAVNLTFNQFATGIVEVIFVQPAIAFDGVSEDTLSQNANVGATNNGQQPSLTIATTIANDLVIAGVATLTNSGAPPVTPSFSTNTPGIISLDSGSVQTATPSTITGGILTMGLQMFVYSQAAAGGLTLSEVLNPATAPNQVSWVQFGLGVYESSSPSMITPVVAINAAVSQQGSASVITAGGLISGQIVPSGTPAGPILKLPMGT
jgi:hypothetical protein